MLIAQVKKCLPLLAKCNLVPFLWGHHGVGKTQAIAQYCRELGYFFINLRLGTQDVGDLIGLADFLKDSNGNKMGSRFMTPEWLLKIIEYATNNPNSRAVIVLDEINRAPREVLQAIFELLLDKKMHLVELPKNVDIICLGNPSTDDYILTDLADKALIDRFCHIKVSPTLGEWLNYGKSQNFDSDVLDFFKQHPECLDGKVEEFSLNFVEPSRRSGEALSNLKTNGLMDLPDGLQREVAQGILGIAATTAFFSWLEDNQNKPFTVNEVLKKYDKIEQRLDKYSKENRLDILSASCDKLSEHLSNTKSVPKNQQENLIKFLLKLPAECSFSLLNKIFMTDHKDFLMNDELFDKLMKAKGSLKKIKSDDADAK